MSMSNYARYIMRYATRILRGVPSAYWIAAAGILIVLLAATRKIRPGLFASYVFLLLTVTVLTRQRTYMAQYELIPFWSYRAFFSKGGKRLLAQMLWNVIVFIPVGLLLCRRPFRWALLIGFACSACIEALQLALKCGFFEFDDMFHNVLGTAIGYGLAALFVKLFSGAEKESPEE
jgi:glycopeptide antibiotics resistance protein